MAESYVFIDGDMIAYYACPPRYAKDREGNKVELPEFTPEEQAAYDTKYLANAFNSMKGIIQAIKDAAWAQDALVAVKSPQNFRDTIYDDYKGHRNAIPEELKNKFVPILRHMAVSAGLAIEAVGREADDMLQIWAKEAEEAGHKYTISSGDKDLDCIPGRHIHAKTLEARTLTPEYSMRFFFEQLLKGDPTDKIPGLPGIGPKKAKQWLEPCVTLEDFQSSTIEIYMIIHGAEWKSYLLSNGKMIYLQKHVDDFFNIEGWAMPKRPESGYEWEQEQIEKTLKATATGSGTVSP